MLTYDIEQRGKMPIYEFLYKKIKDDILCSRVKAGEKLPSKRALSQNLKISVVTVENAYAQLALEGYIYSIEKRGYFVCEINAPEYGEKKPPHSLSLTNNAPPLLDISTNSVTAQKFPFSIWARLMRSVLCDDEKNLLKKMPSTGIYELRIAIADVLYRLRAMEVNPDNIIIGAGTDYLYNILIQLLGHDKTYAIENPGHKNISRIYKSNGVKYKLIGLDSEGLSEYELKKSNSDIVHISPSHHYPTGLVMSVGRRFELLNWANDHDGYIIEDDYDSEFRFAGRPIPAMYSLDGANRVIYINTFSKTLAPSIRISYMILPDALMKKYHKQLGFYSCSVSAFEQYTLARFISLGYFEKHINRMKNYYKSQRDYVIDCIKSFDSNKITISEKDSGLHFLLHINTDFTDRTLKNHLKALGIRALMLSDYYDGDDIPDTHTVIINYSDIKREDFQIAAGRLIKIL